MQAAWKVGALIVIFGILMVGAYVYLGRPLFRTQPHTYYIEFPDAGGLRKGSEVLMAGVRIGTVERARLINPQLARIEIEVEPHVQIPEDSQALVTTALIGLGDNPVKIQPGTSGRFLRPGSVIAGRRQNALEGLMPGAAETLDELNQTLSAARETIVAMRGLIEDGELRGEVQRILQTSERTVAQFGQVAARVDRLIAQNQGSVAAIMNEARLAMNDIRQTTQYVASLVQDDRWRDQAGQILDSINATTQRAEELIASLNALVNDPELRSPMAETARNVQIMTETGTRIAANAEEISRNGIIISEKAIELTDRANELAEEAKSVLERLGGFFGRAPAAGILTNLQASLDILHETNPRHLRTDIEFMLPLPDYNLHLGIVDAFESNRLSVQLGRQFAPNGQLRYGIYSSKPGIGVDYQLAPRLHLRADLFDINRPRADIRARYDFGRNFHGWVGITELFGKTAPMFGFGFRR
jgi:phospholipid/cholesterol/gamma-HCH transport system substrate-binding protein